MKAKQIVAVACAALMLTACGSKAANNAKDNKDNKAAVETSASQQPKGDGVKVVTSTYILRDLTEEIAGDKAQVTCLIPKGQGVHGFEPSPKDINSLNDADLFIYNGAGLESFTDSLKDTLEGDAVLVEASKGIELLEGGHHHHHDGEEADEHNHDNNNHDNHNNDAAENNHDNNNHDADEHHDEHDHDGKDPHVWMSPENADKMAANIAEALIAKDPDNAQYYKDNLAKVHEKFEALDESFDKVLSNAKHKDIVVSHEAYGYLAKEFGLNQIPIEGINSESEPDPKAMKDIIDQMKAKGITTVFTEPQEDDKIAKTVASEAGAEVKELDPMEYESDKNYFERMESNLKTLESALQ
ncbi:MAG: metal ABC transporter substrate-binding protein [Peptoniphilus sp.]|nr:metal ABC transporter substrate-binding protein [Peptoniphilus sp.]MDY3118254.1 metal ABC transporter substrate-binding protein [Peptoniphilus sp.]